MASLRLRKPRGESLTQGPPPLVGLGDDQASPELSQDKMGISHHHSGSQAVNSPPSLTPYITSQSEASKDGNTQDNVAAGKGWKDRVSVAMPQLDSYDMTDAAVAQGP